jgi:hypothetical protein
MPPWAFPKPRLVRLDELRPIFQAAVKAPPVEDNERRCSIRSPGTRRSPTRGASVRGADASGSELLIDEPEPASDAHERNPPARTGAAAAGGRGVPGHLKWLAVAALAAAHRFSILLLRRRSWVEGPNGGALRHPRPPRFHRTPPSDALPRRAPATPKLGDFTGRRRPGGDHHGDPDPGQAFPRQRRLRYLFGRASRRRSEPSGRDSDGDARSVPPSTSGRPRPPRTSGARWGRRPRADGITGAARAFQREIRGSADKFTLALGLCCLRTPEDSSLRLGRERHHVFHLRSKESCYRVI